MRLGATSMLARAEVRRAWRVLVALGILAGLALGIGLAAAQVARRTATAYDRLVHATGAPDAVVLALGSDARAEKVGRQPGVARSWTTVGGVARVGGDAVQYLGVFAGLRPPPPGLFTPVYVDGGPPDATSPNDLVVSERLARAFHLSVGDRVPLHFLTAEEITQFDTGFGRPDGPAVDMRVVGVVRSVSDGTANAAEAFSTPALARLLRETNSGYPTVFVQLDRGADGIPAFRRATQQLAKETPPGEGAGEFLGYDVQVPVRSRAAIDVTTRVLVIGLSAFAAITALAGLLACALALRRQLATSELAPPTLRALGATGTQVWWARFVALGPFVAVATLVALVVAVACSAIGPAGSIARQEPAPGWSPNVALLAAGAGVVALLLLALAALVALVRRQEVAARRPSPAVGRLAARGAPAPVVLGARFALEPGRGRSALPVRSVLLATVLGLTGVVGILVWSANLDHLVARPSTWGWTADASADDVTPATIARLAAARDVEAVAEVMEANVDVGGETTTASALTDHKGHVGWTVYDGRLPERRGEILVGARLARQLGVDTGDHVTVHPRHGDSAQLDVVGIGSGPDATSTQFAGDVVMVPADVRHLALTDPFSGALIRFRSGVDKARAADALASDVELTRPSLPLDVDNLAQLGALPEALAAVLALLVVAVLLHFLVTTTRRRRAEFASLRALGFRPRQTRRTVVVTAFVITGLGLVLGIPLGFVVGRFGWRATASAIYVGDSVAVPIALLLGIVGAAGVVTVLAAAWPAWRLTRRPARLTLAGRE